MSDYVYQEFPKVKYHPQLGTRTVRNAEEEKGLGRGWHNNPNEFPKPSAAAKALKKAKPWWDEWEWSFKAVITISGAVAVIASFVVFVVHHFAKR